MDTTNLLNIKPNTTDVITGQALAMVSSDNNKTDMFKSAFNNQMDKNRNEQSRSEKDLPQNGNDLPKKKAAIDENDRQSNKNDSVNKTEHDNSTAQKNDLTAKNTEQNNEQTDRTKQENSHEQDNGHEQNNGHEQDNGREQDNPHAQKDSPDQENTSEQGNNSEQANALVSENAENIQSEIEQAAISLQLGNTAETKIITEQSESEQKLSSELNNSGLKNLLYAGSDSLSIDKKIQSEMTKSQLNPGSVISNSNTIADSTIKIGMSSGSDNKNESPLSKSIADFQQFIEMSKKHSMAGETITSVKSFEQSMKAGQLNAQALLVDGKLLSGQGAGQGAAQLSAQASTQVVMSAPLLGRVDLSMTQSVQSLSQSMASLDVKTGVGKAGWNQSFSNQIVMMANNGVQQAKIKLNPMSLGPVEAMVKLSGETAVVNLTSLHLTTKDALESAIPRLKEMLNENGFSQVDVNVSHQDKREQQEAALDSKTGSNNEHGNSTMPGDEQLSEETLDSETGAQVSGLDEQGLNIVDYYA